MARPKKLASEILAAALSGLEEQRNRIDRQIAELRAMMGKRGPGRPPAAGRAAAAATPAKKASRKRAKRKLSSEGRARIIAAANKRWAAIKRQKEAEG